MVGKTLRATRIRAAISGYAICLKAGIGRSRLSDIERGHVQPSAEEIVRLNAAVDELIRARQRVEAVAAEVGCHASCESMCRSYIREADETLHERPR